MIDKPYEIEKKSMEIIEEELRSKGLLDSIDPTLLPLFKRVIHTSADFDYAENLKFINFSLEDIKKLLMSGTATIITDTNMALSGINKTVLKNSGAKALCFMNDEEVKKAAKERGKTRAIISMEYASGLYKNAIYSIGNAPTALIRTGELIEQGLLNPALIIAVPVGFVNVVESKKYIERVCKALHIPLICAEGRKGGSNISAAIINALFYSIENIRNEDSSPALEERKKDLKNGEDKNKAGVSYEDKYIISHGRKLRCGFTTGSCAALSALGAARNLFAKKALREPLAIMTPKGVEVKVLPESSSYDEKENTGYCSVLKDAGEDMDVTDGIEIFARVSLLENSSNIVIEGGEGIGRVTRKGLSQDVGEKAINPVPLAMIEESLERAREEAGLETGLKCTISVPKGEEIALSTFNKNLGIEGGISIIGTTGIVEPMSEKAFSDAICLEISQLAAEGYKRLILLIGNYGKEYIKRPEFSDFKHVVCSNFIGEAIDAVIANKYEEVLIVGHSGKLIKLSGGIMNTHSLYADCRLELITLYAALNGAPLSLCKRLLDQVSTDEALRLLSETDIYEKVLDSLLDKIQYHINERIRRDRAAGTIKIGALLFTGNSKENSLLGISSVGKEILYK
ncbi:MAG: cobalt-precorrin-5B (C(1))-methyltransferase CbiD [Lachnospiraceae bacterium]|nr:cobalt-precorrin-5B (C(1))-methyltransferase CbiD [Lachnospiraceae bacterium]